MSRAQNRPPAVSLNVPFVRCMSRPKAELVAVESDGRGLYRVAKKPKTLLEKLLERSKGGAA